MITNIIDDRKSKYKFLQVYGVIEPTCHDNSCKDADQLPPENIGRCIFSGKEPMTLSELLEWGSKFDGNNTLFIRNTPGDELIEL